MNSGNHVMLLGDLLTWLFEDVAGIQPLSPGFSEVRLRPHFLFEQVSCRHQSIHGIINSSWTTEKGRVRWEVDIPANVSAIVELPVAQMNLLENREVFAPCEDGEGHLARLKITPGRHVLNFADC